jgi:exodeoxyribonuclease VII small subunit
MAQRRSRRIAKEAIGMALPSDMSFEDAFTQMQQVITQLESGDIPLEEAIAAFEQGVRLAQHCNILLDRAQLRVQALDETADGALRLADVEIVTE